MHSATENMDQLEIHDTALAFRIGPFSFGAAVACSFRAAQENTVQNKPCVRCKRKPIQDGHCNKDPSSWPVQVAPKQSFPWVYRYQISKTVSAFGRAMAAAHLAEFQRKHGGDGGGDAGGGITATALVDPLVATDAITEM